MYVLTNESVIFSKISLDRYFSLFSQTCVSIHRISAIFVLHFLAQNNKIKNEIKFKEDYENEKTNI